MTGSVNSENYSNAVRQSIMDRSEETKIRIGSRVIPLTIQHSPRAKHISLRISQARNSVILILPKHAKLESGMKFLSGKQDWILENVEEYKNVRIISGTIIPVLGKEYMVRRTDGRGVTHMDAEKGEITVYCDPEFTARRVKDFLVKYLRERCLRRSQVLAERIGKTVKKVSISKAQSHWGSCNGRNALTFNWLLVFAPAEILEYIIAHEVAHLKHMHHRPPFWKVVEELYPDVKEAREWLKENGYTLHRYE